MLPKKSHNELPFRNFVWKLPWNTLAGNETVTREDSYVEIILLNPR